MRVVVDMNVLVSGLLRADNPPGRIVDLIVGGRLSVLFDDRITREYEDVLSRPRFDFDATSVHAVLRQLRATGEHVVAAPLAVVLPDPDDLPFLEVAVAGGARALITGNRSHYKPRAGTHTVPVRSPRDFVTEWTHASSD
ncbi:MAG TPA: putative toxin-antitoxin system toxin component, PIN family [Gemmatimonadaceae bacterium]|nr:putative toxin-antitoxin system toxin component, PIN family [Gemmatimonadaceae bacterium]